MRFYSHFDGLALFLVVAFLNPCHFAWADDIEIDLGGNAASSSKVEPSSNTNSKQKKSSEVIKGDSEEDSSLSDDSSKTGASTSGSAVNKVSISSEADGSRLSIDGDNLPEPSVEKISEKKILLKFPKTKLRIKKNIAMRNEMLSGVRSAPHPGVAWVVLDVKGVKKWELSKSDEGYSLLLLSGKGSSNASEVLPEASTTVDEKGTANGKRLFSRLIDVSLKPFEKTLKIVLTSDGSSKYTVRKLSRPEKLIIRFHDSKLEVSEKLKKFTGQNEELQKGGLLFMEMRQIGPKFSPISEAILTLLPGTVHQIDRDLNQVIVTLTAPAAQVKQADKKGNLNQLVSMDVEGADLMAVVKTLANEAGFDVDMVSGNLAGVVNQKFKDVPLKTVLATLLAVGSYDFEVQGNTLRIGSQETLKNTKALLPHTTELISPTGGMTMDQFDALVRQILKPSNAVKSVRDATRNVIILEGTPSDIQDYKKTIRDLKLDDTSNSERITRIIKLNYADPDQMIIILTQYLTPVGRVREEVRANGVHTNNLIIWESASNMGVLLELIKELDVRAPQVLIESNIVEVNEETDLNLGISWSAIKATGDPTMNGSFNNLPANAAANPGSFNFGTIRSGLNISATLQALETHKKGKIISRPRIATASGVAANIQTVETVIVSTTTTTITNGISQTTTSFSSLGLPINLNVTPRITDDGRITTIVSAQITSQTGPSPGGGAPPPTSQQTATTTITTKNGETIVIGGLVREVTSDTINGIPILSSIPIIGDLFKQHEKANRRVELIIFITPTLLED
jgi:type II secretory pathway component GspD/PulD (secretin)